MPPDIAHQSGVCARQSSRGQALYLPDLEKKEPARRPRTDPVALSLLIYTVQM
jgi:hypothetical protein